MYENIGGSLSSTWSDGTEDVAATPSGAGHELHWDVPSDGVTQSDSAVLRVTVPDQGS